jgi:hypothetical protein
MDVTEVSMVNGARVFVLENVLESKVLAHAHVLAQTFSTENPLWHRAGTADNFPRWEYDTNDASFDLVRHAVDRGPMLDYWQQKLAPNLDRRLFCSNITFFVDLPGSTPLAPHVEGSSSWLSQVYIARQTDNINGTTMYNNDKQVLFQLPYRNNMGWLFDNGSTVMHGREHGVPPGLDRFSLMIWYALLPQ